MADAALDIPVEVDEGKTVEIALEKPDAGAASGDNKANVVSEREGIESLKEQIARAKSESAQRLAEKDRLIQEAYRTAQAATQEATVARKDLVGGALEGLIKDKETAKRDLRAAHEAANYDAIADAQDRLSMANARIVEAEKAKLALEEEAKNPPRQPVPINDPAEVLASQLSPRSAAWVRSHPEYARDPRLNRQMVRAHEDALDEGHAADSDGYFDYINAKLAPRQEARAQTNGRDVSRNSPLSAPVSRSAPQSPGQQRPGTVRLEPGEVQTAIDTFSPIFPNETREQLLHRYAQHKAALIEEGKYGRQA